MLYELQVYRVGPNRDLERPRCSDALGVDQASLFLQASVYTEKKTSVYTSVFNKFYRPICVLAPVVDLPLLNQGKGYDTLVTGRMLM